MPPTASARRGAAIVLGVYSALVVLVALVPRPIDEGVTPSVRGFLAWLRQHGLAGWIDYEFVELASHVVLFVPVGALAVVALGRGLTWLAVLAGVGMGALVEFAPSLVSDHAPSSLDLLLNTAGAIAGVAIGYAVLTGLRSGPGSGDPRRATKS